MASCTSTTEATAARGSPLMWQRRHKIALGAARPVAYLHVG
jgi:hypothetical protein